MKTANILRRWPATRLMLGAPRPQNPKPQEKRIQCTRCTCVLSFLFPKPAAGPTPCQSGQEEEAIRSECPFVLPASNLGFICYNSVVYYTYSMHSIYVHKDLLHTYRTDMQTDTQSG